MGILVSDELSRILGYAREEAMRTGAYEIEPDHLMLAILRHDENSACYALKALGVDLSDLKHFVEAQIFRRESVPYTDEEKVDFSRDSRGTLNMSLLEASSCGQNRALAAHLLLAISRNPRSLSKSYLDIEGLTHEVLAKYLQENSLLGGQEEKKERKEKKEKNVIHIVVGKPKVYS